MKKYLSTIKIIISALILALGIQYAFAVSRPGTIPESGFKVIDTAGTSIGFDTSHLVGYIEGEGRLRIKGDLPIDQTISPKLEVVGNVLTTGLRVDGNVDVVGSLTSSKLKTTTGQAPVCVDSFGILKKC